MIFTDRRMAQLVIDPTASTDYQLEAALAGAEVMERMTYHPLVLLRARVLKRFHPFVHHFVVWKTYDAASRRLVDVGTVCAYCSIARPG